MQLAGLPLGIAAPKKTSDGVKMKNGSLRISFRKESKWDITLNMQDEQSKLAK